MVLDSYTIVLTKNILESISFFQKAFNWILFLSLVLAIAVNTSNFNFRGFNNTSDVNFVICWYWLWLFRTFLIFFCLKENNRYITPRILSSYILRAYIILTLYEKPINTRDKYHKNHIIHHVIINNCLRSSFID